MHRAVPTVKDRLLNAALKVIRTKGYDATTVDDLCREAGVTKGAFFHHFKSKVTGKLFETAPYHQPKEPLHRLLAYIDFRADIMSGPLPEFTCLLGTMVQETFATNESLREACDIGISSHAATLEQDISDAMSAHGITGFTAQSLALYTQATLQGAFILAKAKNNAGIARDTVAHLRRYIELLFSQNTARLAA
jgi:TetR/AcrR family transcriptional regulator, transcriptional repressor for nem operon